MAQSAQRVGDILLEMKKVTRAQLIRALALVEREGLVIGEALVKLGIVPQSIVDDAVDEQRRRQMDHSRHATLRVVKAADGIIALSAAIGHEFGGKLS